MVDAGAPTCPLAHRAFTAERAAKRQRRPVALRRRGGRGGGARARSRPRRGGGERRRRRAAHGDRRAAGRAAAAGFDSLVHRRRAVGSGGGKGGGKAKGGTAKAKGVGNDGAPTDEEFERIQAELASRAARGTDQRQELVDVARQRPGRAGHLVGASG